MTIGQSAREAGDSATDGSRGPGLTTAQTLRLLGAGASGAILMTLGEGPLRTKELTRRVQGYTPRTVYRYAAKLTQLGVIEREEEPGVPSKVVHSLSEPCGRELHDLMEAYADASLSRLPTGEIDVHAWGSLGLLADLWESGMIEELSLGPCSTTDLSRGARGLSYHQVSRRTDLFVIAGLLEERDRATARRGRSYQLTDKARRAMALIAGIGRWRRRHIVPKGKTGLTAVETSGVLRTALPLVAMPEHGGKSFGIHVMGPENRRSGDGTVLWLQIDRRGAVLSAGSAPERVDGRAHAGVRAWVDALLDGFHKEVKTEGDRRLIEACMSRLHAALWRKPEAAPPGRARSGG